jgi:hypothetical protein
MTGSFAPCITSILVKSVFASGAVASRPEAADNGAHRPTPARHSVEGHDRALRKAEERDAVEPPSESMLLDFAGDHPIKRHTCVLDPLRTIGLGDAGDAEPLTSRTAAVEPLWPIGRGKDRAAVFRVKRLEGATACDP